MARAMRVAWTLAGCAWLAIGAMAQGSATDKEAGFGPSKSLGIKKPALHEEKAEGNLGRLPLQLQNQEEGGGENPPLQGQSEKKAHVLVLGTFHMANPGRDIFNLKVDDVLTEKRQKEIAETVAGGIPR